MLYLLLRRQRWQVLKHLLKKVRGMLFKTLMMIECLHHLLDGQNGYALHLIDHGWHGDVTPVMRMMGYSLSELSTTSDLTTKPKPSVSSFKHDRCRHEPLRMSVSWRHEHPSANRGIGYVTLCDTTDTTALHAKGPLLQLLQTSLNTS